LFRVIAGFLYLSSRHSRIYCPDANSLSSLEYFGLSLAGLEEEYNAPEFDIDFSKFTTEEELEFLGTKRIEIDSVMMAVNDNQRFWDYKGRLTKY